MSEQLNVQQAWANVMADVQALGKGQRNKAQGFNFRGVDDVMNAVGPALRKYGVMVVPEGVNTSHRDVETNKGAKMREATVQVQYRIYGPAGDSMAGAAAGEAADSGDKGTPKAMSVAYRTFLLQALCLPTDEPDPDQHTMQRGAPSDADLQTQALGAITNAHADEATLREWGNRLHGKGWLGVCPYDGKDITFGDIIKNRLQALRGQEGGSADAA